MGLGKVSFCHLPAAALSALPAGLCWGLLVLLSHLASCGTHKPCRVPLSLPLLPLPLDALCCCCCFLQQRCPRCLAARSPAAAGLRRCTLCLLCPVLPLCRPPPSLLRLADGNYVDTTDDRLVQVGSALSASKQPLHLLGARPAHQGRSLLPYRSHNVRCALATAALT